jgi:tetratricopeptide (TPR) repeat protein
MARDVAASLRLNLTSEEERRLTRSDPEDVDAYLLYREGMYHWNKFTEERTRTAIEYFERALGKDPGYAMAYAGLAQCYAQLGNMYVPPHEGYPKAKEALLKALALDETMVQVHVMLAYVALSYDWNWLETERHLERAALLGPNYPAVYGVKAGYLAAMGRLDEAIHERLRARELEPTAFRGLGLAGSYLAAGRYDEAISEARQTLARADQFFLARGVLGLGLALQGNHEEALAELQTARDHARDHSQILGYLGYAYARAGRADDARRTLGELMKIPRRRPGVTFHAAVIHAGLGNHDEAFHWLHAAYAERYATMIFLKSDPLFQPLRDDRRFYQLLVDIGLTHR